MVRKLLATLAAAAACGALGQPAVTLTPLQPTTKAWRDRLDFRVDVGGTCSFPGTVTGSGTTDLVLPTLTWTGTLGGAACNGGVLTANPSSFTDEQPYLWFGTHQVFARAHVATTAGEQSATSAPVTVVVVPDSSLPGPGGLVDLALADPFGQPCTARAYGRADAESASVPRPPTAMRITYGYSYFGASGCGTQTPMEFFLMTTPGGFPDGAQLWIYESNVAAPAWRRATPAQDYPGQVESWAVGDARGVGATVAIAYANHNSYGDDVNGLWWGGADQDGWGIDVSRVADRMFAALFIHDASSAPRWVVMPAGRWESGQFAWTGDLYEPRGAPFAMGPPVGQAVLAFDDAAHGRIAYTLEGRQGTKELARFDAPGHSPAQDHAGLWWTPAESGKGLSVRTVGDAVFAAWYTYDMNGETTWYYLPGGAWTGARFQGSVYRTTGTPWPGSHATATTSQSPFGTATLDFGAADALAVQVTIDGASRALTLQRFAF